MDHVDCVAGVLLHRHQLDGAPNFTQCFLFPAEPGINQSKDAKCGTKLCLFLHDFFLSGTTRCESGPRLIFVLQHSPEQTTAEGSIELYLVVAKGGIPKRVEGCFPRRGIPVCQSTEEPHIGDALNSLWTLGSNL